VVTNEMNRKGYRGNEKRKEKGRERSFFRPLLFLLLFGLIVLGIVGARISIVELTIKTGELEKERKELETEVKRLEMEVTQLSSQKRIETIARESLGMHYPGLSEVSSIRMNER